MKQYLILLIFCLVTYTDLLKAQNISNPVLSTTAMQQDFNYLRKTLEDTHPGLYIHQPKEVMQHKMDSLYSLLDKPMSFYQFYGIIANLIAEVKCDHTSSSPYINDVLQANIQQYKLIPFFIYFSEHKAYVAVNLTRDTSIHIGDEVCNINNQPADSLERALFKYVPADGNIETSKERFLSSGMAFNIWYYFFIDRPDAFDIVFKSPRGILKEKRFADGLTFAESVKNVMSNPANKQILAMNKAGKRDIGDPWRLEIINKNQTAILIVRTFSGDKKKMNASFAKFFAKIKQENISNLIIDLEDNPGGDEAAAAELFSYLINTPTKFMASEYLITDSDDYLKLSDLPAEVLTNKDKFLQPERDGKFFVKEETQGELLIVEPKSNHFTGKVYFHITGGTASAASTFAAVAQSNHLGTFIGEETGGAYFGGGSSVGLNLTLPNTRITAHTSINYNVFATNGDHDRNRGVIPDYHFVPTFQELISGNKSWRSFILKLIDEGK